MQLWYSYEKLVRKITYAGAYIGGFMLVLMFLLVFTEVVLRTFFNSSTMVSDEISGYLMAGGFFLASAYALQEGAIVRIDILYNRFPLKLRCFLDIFIDLVVLCYTVILFKYTFDYMYKSLVNSARSVSFIKTPLWIPQLFNSIPVSDRSHRTGLFENDRKDFAEGREVCNRKRDNRAIKHSKGG